MKNKSKQEKKYVLFFPVYFSNRDIGLICDILEVNIEDFYYSSFLF